MSASDRRGAAVIEFAIILPVLAVISFGSIQLGHLILLRNKALTVVETSSIEYSIGTIDAAELSTRMQELAAEAGLAGATATTTSQTEDFLRLTLTVPTEDNRVAIMGMYLPDTVRQSLVVYRREESQL